MACEEQKVTALAYVSCVLFCFSHAMTSSVIYYSTDAHKNEIYLLSLYCNLMVLISVEEHRNNTMINCFIAQNLGNEAKPRDHDPPGYFRS